MEKTCEMKLKEAYKTTEVVKTMLMHNVMRLSLNIIALGEMQDSQSGGYG